ncbi:hypothetical protein BpHYR1_020748 [Brachionus plicatilis]|uniref:Uncharacterized protein n=1 Tax=Brachionus plicatilis TaxID=10195 RepID=A0A3M7T4C1_BRAPC|nr:hypothetical protein BpHYR1_020748 [Brachionus plicatilis]
MYKNSLQNLRKLSKQLINFLSFLANQQASAHAMKDRLTPHLFNFIQKVEKGKIEEESKKGNVQKNYGTDIKQKFKSFAQIDELTFSPKH